MRRPLLIALASAAALLAAGVRADDLRGVDRFLCAPVQAMNCLEGGDCVVALPWDLNMPQFVEVDLGAKRLSTTKASGENRATPILHLTRDGGLIVIQGFENGRAFSFVITEETGRVAVAMAGEGKTVAVFGSCTPMPAGPEAGRK